MPIRSSIRLSCGTSIFCSATPRWISSAHRTASTTLANSTRAPSPSGYAHVGNGSNTDIPADLDHVRFRPNTRHVDLLGPQRRGEFSCVFDTALPLLTPRALDGHCFAGLHIRNQLVYLGAIQRALDPQN